MPAPVRRYAGSLWSVPAYLDYVQPKLTPSAVRAAETQLAVKLPAAYVAMLEEQNGGFLRGSWPESPGHTLYGIGPQFPSITLDGAWWRPKNAADDQWIPRKPELLIPFDGDGHWNLCFDYRARGARAEPSITFVDNEVRHEKRIAKSFDAYLAGLVDEKAETSLRVYGDVTAAGIMKQLGKQLGVAAPTVDAAAHGHPVHRLALPGKYQWCWASENRVPSGFRRKGREVIVPNSTALQIPEDPACSVLLAWTAESEALITAALETLGIPSSRKKR